MNDYTEYYTHRQQARFAQPIIAFWHQRMLTIANRYIPQLASKTILEIGAGHGFLAAACQQKKLSYCGHEMNITQAHALAAAGHDVTPATIPPIPAGKPTQIIWLSHVLEHAATFHEAKAMLHACHDRLDPEGYVVIIAPDVLHWKQEFWAVDWSHGFPTSLNRVEQLLNETNFSVTHALHHSCTITNPFLAWCISSFFIITAPIYNLIDFILYKTMRKRFCYSFLSIFGWRQIYLIAKKSPGF